jgi:hypothetical protein
MPHPSLALRSAHLVESIFETDQAPDRAPTYSTGGRCKPRNSVHLNELVTERSPQVNARDKANQLPL